jgi:hypothetical protein
LQTNKIDAKEVEPIVGEVEKTKRKRENYWGGGKREKSYHKNGNMRKRENRLEKVVLRESR